MFVKTEKILMKDRFVSKPTLPLYAIMVRNHRLYLLGTTRYAAQEELKEPVNVIAPVTPLLIEWENYMDLPIFYCLNNSIEEALSQNVKVNVWYKTKSEQLQFDSAFDCLDGSVPGNATYIMYEPDESVTLIPLLQDGYYVFMEYVKDEHFM